MPTRPQIINHMLGVLGEGGVSYDMTLHPTVQQCNGTLDITSADMQGRGWWFNKEYGLKLLQDNNGEVLVPANALDMTVASVVNMGPSEKLRYVRRDNRIYDAVEHTYNIGRPVAINATMLLEINDIPSVAQTYIMHVAAANIFLDQDGDIQKYGKLQERVSLAWQALQAQQLKNIATNALDGTVARELASGWRPAGQGRNPNFIGGRLR